MKAGNHKMIGSPLSCLKKDKKYKQVWADYFVRWVCAVPASEYSDSTIAQIQAYEKKNIPIWGVTQQNEPQ